MNGSNQGGRLLSQRSLDALSCFLEGAEEALSPHEKSRARLRAQQLRGEKMAWVDRHLLHAYIPAKKLRKIELVYNLTEVSFSEANLILRVVDSLPQMSKLRLICDLAFEQDPRAYAESRRMFGKLLEGDS